MFLLYDLVQMCVFVALCTVVCLCVCVRLHPFQVFAAAVFMDPSPGQ